MKIISRIIMLGILTTSIVLAAAAQAAAQVMIVDRGLPTHNLNNPAGDNRSNVSWGETDLNYFDGDTFTVPASGTWKVRTIRLWSVGFYANNNSILTDDSYLGDHFGNVSLYVGPVNSSFNRVALASFLPGSDATTNPNVVATRVQYNGRAGTELDYGNNGPAGAYTHIVQIDFKNLNRSFPGGTQVQFGMLTDRDYTLSHASNAGLSGSRQDQADNLYRQFLVNFNPATATFVTTVDSNAVGWDKSSDINVQVFATLVVPGDKDQCKNNSWMTLARANGTSFKNQGDCIQYVNTGK